MRVNLYSIFDRASGVYDGPFPIAADGQAVRQFTDFACNADHPIGKHPEDYSLFRVGVWDDVKGSVIPQEPECLARAHECFAKSREIDPGQLDAFDNVVPINDPRS